VHNSTIVDADLIIAMDGGLIFEQGTHEQLLSRHGRYAATFAQQTRALALAVGS
jgi:ABC-type multidrug transport system fused ATPase/permease subunit